jgi:hypothetical protein
MQNQLKLFIKFTEPLYNKISDFQTTRRNGINLNYKINQIKNNPIINISEYNCLVKIAEQNQGLFFL